ncbi:hypothetical protein BB561_006119 [Smittium simulii]|uniref:Uncharacterized protein n=1 Tax=Smittium simulii TaxID=133385 RepID=A0A2T9Y6L0_9FUNG|nr:hypothetical protein BB561_006119 [Smittium simulii]
MEPYQQTPRNKQILDRLVEENPYRNEICDSAKTKVNCSPNYSSTAEGMFEGGSEPNTTSGQLGHMGHVDPMLHNRTINLVSGSLSSLTSISPSNAKVNRGIFSECKELKFSDPPNSAFPTNSKYHSLSRIVQNVGPRNFPKYSPDRSFTLENTPNTHTGSLQNKCNTNMVASNTNILSLQNKCNTNMVVSNTIKKVSSYNHNPTSAPVCLRVLSSAGLKIIETSVFRSCTIAEIFYSFYPTAPTRLIFRDIGSKAILNPKTEIKKQISEPSEHLTVVASAPEQLDLQSTWTTTNLALYANPSHLPPIYLSKSTSASVPAKISLDYYRSTSSNYSETKCSIKKSMLNVTMEKYNYSSKNGAHQTTPRTSSDISSHHAAARNYSDIGDSTGSDEDGKRNNNKNYYNDTIKNTTSDVEDMSDNSMAEQTKSPKPSTNSLDENQHRDIAASSKLENMNKP